MYYSHLYDYYELVNNEVLEISLERFKTTDNPAYGTGGCTNDNAVFRNCKLTSDYDKTFRVVTTDGFIIKLKTSNENFILAVQYSKLSDIEVKLIKEKEANQNLKNQMQNLLEENRKISEMGTVISDLHDNIHCAQKHIQILQFLMTQSRKNIASKEIWLEYIDDDTPSEMILISKTKAKELEPNASSHSFERYAFVSNYLDSDGKIFTGTPWRKN